jgi:protein involved in polysaccharide export with SLBB domain
MRLATSCGSVALLLFGLAVSPPEAGAQDSSVSTEQPTAAVSGSPQPGDLIRVKVWREPDLSGDFRVDDKGSVTLPKIGALYVGNMSPDSLRRALTSAYAPDLKNPVIDITLLRRVQVVGSVAKPGLYDADATMTVSDVVALAGGATADGISDRVELRRQGARVAAALAGQERIASTPIRSGDQLFVPQRSWMSRNAGVVVGAAISTVGIIAATLVHR